MQSHLLNQALGIIKSEQYLVNMVSQRVRQLTAGARPMIEVGPRMGFSDIALTEIIEGKLSFTSAPEAPPEPPVHIPTLPPFARPDRAKSPPAPARESVA